MQIFYPYCRPGAVLNEWECWTASTPWRVPKISLVVRAWNALTAYVLYEIFTDDY